MVKKLIPLLLASLILSASAPAALSFKKGSMEVGGSLAAPTIISRSGLIVGMELGLSFGFFASSSLSLGLAAGLASLNLNTKYTSWFSHLKAVGKYYFNWGSGLRPYTGAGLGAANINGKYSPALSAVAGLILPLAGRFTLDVSIPAELILAKDGSVFAIPSPIVGVRAFF